MNGENVKTASSENSSQSTIISEKPKSMLDLVEFLSSSSSGSDTDYEDDIEEIKLDSNETVVEKEKKKNYNHEVADLKRSSEKKKELLSLIHQLHTHIVMIEKEKKSLLYNKKRLNLNANIELEEVENKMNEKRRKEKVQIEEHLNKISSKITKFSREKEETKKSPVYIEKLKVLMEEIEENIMQFKEKQKMVYEDLMVDSKTLTNEMEAFENKLNSWQQQVAPTTKLRTATAKINKKGNKNEQPKEVEEFERFLKFTGGHQGGWDDIDHQAFLKLNKQHKNNEQLVEACLRDLPTQGREDIKQHLDWYEEYCILRERKREAIKAWKNLKENEREDKLRNVEVDSTKEEIKKKRREALLEKERNDRLMALKAYKEEKQCEDEKQSHQKAVQEEEANERKKMNRIMQQQKQLEMKMQVEEYKMKKKEEDEILQQARIMKELQQQQEVSEEERNRIKQRNAKLLTSKQEQKQLKERKEEEKERRLERIKRQVEVNVERDPNRLYKLTAGWQHRKDDISKSNSVVTGSRMMPQRAVPSWRQGLS